MLAIGPGERKVQCVRRGGGRSDLLTLSPATEQWLRHGYQQRISTPAVLRDLGPILAHGEPETGMGQGEEAEAAGQGPPAEPALQGSAVKGNGARELVTVDFRPDGPHPPPAAPEPRAAQQAGAASAAPSGVAEAARGSTHTRV